MSHNGLGIMYRDGLGVPRDMAKALSHFQTAAAADHPEALVNLGRFHFSESPRRFLSPDAAANERVFFFAYHLVRNRSKRACPSYDAP